jgi:hypothetical protein
MTAGFVIVGQFLCPERVGTLAANAFGDTKNNENSQKLTNRHDGGIRAFS